MYHSLTRVSFDFNNSGGGPCRRFPGHRLSGWDHLHGAKRPGLGCALPDVARQLAVHLAPGHHRAVLCPFRHIPVLRYVDYVREQSFCFSAR